MSRYRCAAPISLMNEVLVGLEWRGLIGQQLLPEEEQELICDYIIPWLDNNAFTLSNDGTFYSDSIIPSIVRRWLIRRGARLALAPPTVGPTTTVFNAQRGARPSAAPPSVASTASSNSTGAPPRRRTTARPSQNGAVDTTQGAIRVRRTGPPHVDHPVFSPKINALMRASGICIVDGIIYAPEGINKFLKRSWELMLKTGKPYNSDTPPSTSSDDSDSTPPKRNQKKPAIARKKPVSKQPTGNSAKSPSPVLALQSRPTLIDPNDPNTVFTGPPPNATEAEINAWVDLWFRHHTFAPRSSTTPPPWVQNWIDNAEAYFTRRMAANASSNNPSTTVATSAAPPLDATEDEIADAVHTWIRTHRVIVRNGVMHCLDPAQSVPKCVQDRVAYNLAQIASLEDDARNTKGIRQQLPAKKNSPTTNAEDNHASNTAETSTTNDTPAAAEAETNTSNTAENATIVIDDQGNTADDPIVIAESTSNSDNDSADEAAKST